jgi:hypothetical protein
LGKKHNLLLNFSWFKSMVVNKLWQQTHLLLTLPAPSPPLELFSFPITRWHHPCLHLNNSYVEGTEFFWF